MVRWMDIYIYMDGQTDRQTEDTYLHVVLFRIHAELGSKNQILVISRDSFCVCLQVSILVWAQM